MDNPAILKLRHVGIVVSDMYESLHFYSDLLGFEKVLQRYEDSDYFKKVNDFDAEALTYKIRVPDGRVLELIEYKKPKSHAKIGYNQTMIGRMHLCFLVDNVNEFYQRLIDRNVRFLSEPQGSINDPAIVVTCLDPDDNQIEFVEIRGKMPKGLEA